MQKKYKTELHCHSRDASPCADESADGIVEKYVKYGYSTVVLTNHFSAVCHPTADYDKKSWAEKVRHFVNAYEILKDAAGDRLNILLGAEIRFPQYSNDYLVFGLTEEYLLVRENFYLADIQAFHDEAWRELVTIQAHPFRWNMHVVFPWAVDGYEVFNGHPGQNSANKAAAAYAEYYPEKIITSGSDHHDKEHVPTGGIVTDFEIKTNEELIEVLKGRRYSLITDEGIKEVPKNG